jgi:hypothetical protein
MASRYSYVRFRWWDTVDLDKVAEEFLGFEMKKIIHEPEGKDLSILRGERGEIEVKADTLQVLLSPFRAVLNQKEAKPFTVRDMELREKIMRIYPRNSPAPFPWEFSLEPKFEKEK